MTSCGSSVRGKSLNARCTWRTSVGAVAHMFRDEAQNRLAVRRWLLVFLLLLSDQGTWSRGAPMPTERGEVGAAAVDGRIYVVGAYSGATSANEAYDPTTDSWQALAPLPRGLNHVCAVGVGGA